MRVGNFVGAVMSEWRTSMKSGRCPRRADCAKPIAAPGAWRSKGAQSEQPGGFGRGTLLLHEHQNLAHSGRPGALRTPSPAAGRMHPHETVSCAGWGMTGGKLGMTGAGSPLECHSMAHRGRQPIGSHAGGCRSPPAVRAANRAAAGGPAQRPRWAGRPVLCKQLYRGISTRSNTGGGREP